MSGVLDVWRMYEKDISFSSFIFLAAGVAQLYPGKGWGHPQLGCDVKALSSAPKKRRNIQALCDPAGIPRSLLHDELMYTNLTPVLNGQYQELFLMILFVTLSSFNEHKGKWETN